MFNSIKYLGVKIDENLNWKDHTQDIATKLSRANALFFKIRNYVKFNTLESIYFAIFDSHINYAKPELCIYNCHLTEKNHQNYK